MQKWKVLFFLAFLSSGINAQSIYSALQLNQDREYKTVKPKRIVETNTFYSARGNTVRKNVKNFDEAGMLLTEERYGENGTLETRLTYVTDTVNRLKLTNTFERWTRFGYIKETAFYSYDNNKFLVGITHKDANGNVISQANLVCNDNGHPIELFLFDGSGDSFGRETASYLYDRNKVVTTVISNDGRVISTDSRKINFTTASQFADSNEIYNTKGDLTNWIRKSLNGTETILEGEYTYDSVGNCTENKIYEVIIKRKGKKKKDLDRIFKKEYQY